MKKFIIPVCLLAPCLSMAQVKFEIKGRVGKVNAPAKVLLRYWIDGAWIIDSADVRDGVFQFKGTAPYPVSANLLLRRNGPEQKNISEGRNFWLEAGTIQISGGDSLQKTTVKAGAVNKSFDRLNQMLAPGRERSAAFFREYYQLPADTRKNPEMAEKVRQISLAREKETFEVYAQFMKENPSSPVALELLMYRYGKVPDINVVAPLFNLLSPSLRASKRAIPFAQRLASWEKVNVGQMAPLFTQTDSLNKPVSLVDFRGKYVLINFWATWCGPCMIEKQNLRKTYATFKDKNFEIIDVSMTDTSGKFGDRNKWQTMVRNFKLPWVNVYGDEAVKLYGVEAVPNNFLVDPNGMIIAKNMHKEDLDAKLEELLTKNSVQ